MSDAAFASVYSAVLAAVALEPALDTLLTRGDQRRLVRSIRDWYIGTYADSVARDGTCVVVTSGPPGAGKSSILGSAVDVDTKLIIDPDIAKERLARWCVAEGLYGDLLSTVLPDGRPIMPLELSPLLQTISVEACNATRRTAFDLRMDVVLEATMASPHYGERLLKSLAKSDYVEIRPVLVCVEPVPRRSARSDTLAGGIWSASVKPSVPARGSSGAPSAVWRLYHRASGDRQHSAHPVRRAAHTGSYRGPVGIFGGAQAGP